LISWVNRDINKAINAYVGTADVDYLIACDT